MHCCADILFLLQHTWGSMFKVLTNFKRAGQALLVLFFVTFGVTLLMRLLPGDPASTLFPFSTPDELAEVRSQLGLDKNVFAYYIDWLWKFLHGDLGYYYAATFGDAVKVTSMLAQTLPRTLLLMAYTIIFSLACAIPLGMLLAYKADSRLDKILSNILFAVSSIPNFAVALGLAFVIGVKFDLVNPLGYIPWAENPAEHIKSMILPVFSLSLGLIATFTRLFRSDLISTLKEDFVTMASSKGLSNRWILWRHIFRPSSATLMTAAALNMASLIGGAVIIEVIFSLNGVGMLLNASIAQRQYLAIQSVIALIAVSFVIFNIIVDMLYSIVDPRVRAQSGS